MRTTFYTSSWHQEKREQKRSQTKKKEQKKRRKTTTFVCTLIWLFRCARKKVLLLLRSFVGTPTKKQQGVALLRAYTFASLLFLPFVSKRRDYVVAFGASLTCARNFSSKCSVSTLETNKFKLVLPFQHVMANSDRKALSFWTSSSRSKQTKEPWEQLSTCLRVSESVKLGRGVNLDPSGTGSFSTNAKPLSLRIWRSSGIVIVMACFVMNGKVKNKPSWFNR